MWLEKTRCHYHLLFLKFSITRVKWHTRRAVCEWKTFEPWCNMYRKAEWRMHLALCKLRISTERKFRMGMQDRSVHAAICYRNQLAFCCSSVTTNLTTQKPVFSFGHLFLDLLEVSFFFFIFWMVVKGALSLQGPLLYWPLKIISQLNLCWGFAGEI